MTRSRLRAPLIIVSILLLGLAFSLPSLSKSAGPLLHDAAIEAALAVASGKQRIATIGAQEPLDDAIPTPVITTREPEPITLPPERPLSIMLGWYLTPYHAPLIVARERGLFDNAGLKVSITTPADPSVPVKLVAAERVDLALTSQPRLHLLIENGLPLIRVGTLISAPLRVLLTREDSGIDTLAQLEGKKVGYVLEDQDIMLLDSMLANHPLSRDEIELEKVGFGVNSTLLDGSLDAVIGAQRHVDRQQLAQEGMAVQEMAVEEHGVPAYDELILVANRDTLKQHRHDIVLLLDAIQSATLWIYAHPEEAWELVRQAEPGLDTPANAEAWDDTLRYLELRPSLFEPRRYSRFERHLEELGLVKTITPVERLAVDLNVP